MRNIIATWLEDTAAVLENTPLWSSPDTRLDLLEGRLLILADAVKALEEKRRRKKSKKDKQRRLMEHA